jgi:hypothetical protein
MRVFRLLQLFKTILINFEREGTDVVLIGVPLARQGVRSESLVRRCSSEE